MKVVLDTCILKLATFPANDNPSALIVELALAALIEWWASPAILDEYSHVLADEPTFLADVFAVVEQCFPLTELCVVTHEPDNRFVECALAVSADYLVTVNTARGHFDRKKYSETTMVSPGRFVNLPDVRRLLRQIGDVTERSEDA